MNGGIIVSAVSIILAAAAFINAYTFPGGTFDGVPGAGVFPQAICTLIILINVILMIGSLRKKKDSAPISEEHREGRKRLGLFVGLTAVLLYVIFHQLLNVML